MNDKRNTIQRKLISDAVKELDIHASAEQVYEYIKEKYSSISKATVYRNLSQMAEAGELVNIGDFYGCAHYDHNCQKHYHFVCEECKRIFDINEYFPDICERITKNADFEIKGHNINFDGICAACR